MVKANKKAADVNKSKPMNLQFDELLSVLDDMMTGSEEIMPLFSASLELSIKIARMYKKAFNLGTKYVK